MISETCGFSVFECRNIDLIGNTCWLVRLKQQVGVKEGTYTVLVEVEGRERGVHG